MILPVGAAPVTEKSTQPSLTYRLDLVNGRISGVVDGIQAVEQAVYKILDTERFTHFIYSSSYGLDTRTVGELENAVRSALQQDDRITGIENFQITANGDSAVVSFTVVSVFGPALIERSVDANV
jgi:hypothetical protein